MTDCRENDSFEGKPLSQVLLDVERRYYAWALNKSEGNKSQAARIAGVTYQTFTRKMDSMGLKVTYHAE